MSIDSHVITLFPGAGMQRLLISLSIFAAVCFTLARLADSNLFTKTDAAVKPELSTTSVPLKKPVL